MSKVALIARQPLDYRGHAVAKGEVFHAQPAEAAALLYQRRVAFAPRSARVATREMTPVAAPPPEPPDQTPPKRRYRRRDMQPQP